MCVWNGKKVTEQEYWRLRLSKIVQDGCKNEDLENLKTDLMFTNLSGNNELVQVPSVILEIPIYDYNENDEVVLLSEQEKEEIEELLFSTEDVKGWSVSNNIQSVTYIPKNIV